MSPHSSPSSNAEWNRLQAEVSAHEGTKRPELDAVGRKLDGLINAIAEGLRENMALHDAATGNTLVLDDAPIVVRLAVFLARGLPQKHDRSS